MRTGQPLLELHTDVVADQNTALVPTLEFSKVIVCAGKQRDSAGVLKIQAAEQTSGSVIRFRLYTNFESTLEVRVGTDKGIGRGREHFASGSFSRICVGL